MKVIMILSGKTVLEKNYLTYLRILNIIFLCITEMLQKINYKKDIMKMQGMFKYEKNKIDRNP